jgi:hypothetical protein
VRFSINLVQGAVVFRGPCRLFAALRQGGAVPVQKQVDRRAGTELARVLLLRGQGFVAIATILNRNSSIRSKP